MLPLQDGFAEPTHNHTAVEKMCASRGRVGVGRGLPAAPVGGKTFFTNMKIAFSGDTFILFRITYTNWPTVRSAGTKYLGHHSNHFLCDDREGHCLVKSAQNETEVSDKRARLRPSYQGRRQNHPLFLVDVWNITFERLLHDNLCKVPIEHWPRS